MLEIVFSVQNNMNAYYKAVRFIMTLLLSCLCAVVIGLWIDKRWHSTPFVMLLLLAYAIGANFYLLMKGWSDHEG